MFVSKHKWYVNKTKSAFKIKNQFHILFSLSRYLIRFINFVWLLFPSRFFFVLQFFLFLKFEEEIFNSAALFISVSGRIYQTVSIVRDLQKICFKGGCFLSLWEKKNFINFPGCFEQRWKEESEINSFFSEYCKLQRSFWSNKQRFFTITP